MSCGGGGGGSRGRGRNGELIKSRLNGRVIFMGTIPETVDDPRMVETNLLARARWSNGSRDCIHVKYVLN